MTYLIVLNLVLVSVVLGMEIGSRFRRSANVSKSSSGESLGE